MSTKVFQFVPKDKVLVALADRLEAEKVGWKERTYTLVSNVPAKHKFAIKDFAVGAEVVMYGILVATVIKAIRAGERLTVLNIRHQSSAMGEKFGEFQWIPPDVTKWKQRTFLGYPRSDGQVGTRNYWLVVPLVFCENRNIEVLKQAFETELGFAPPPVYQQQVAHLARLYREGKTDELRIQIDSHKDTAVLSMPLFENIDGVKFLVHQGGCGGTREDSDILCGLIAGYIHHPNVAGATVLSLGCQNAQVAILREEVKKRDRNFSKALFVFEQQQSGSEFTMLSEAIQKTFLGLVEANKYE